MTGDDGRPPSGAGTDGRGRRPGGRRQEILDTATQVFRQKGYHTTSLDDVAEAIGVSKPALYYYFGSKEEILFTIVSGHVDRALEHVRAIAAGFGTVSERMHELLVASVHAVLANRDVNTVFYDERSALSAAHQAEMRARERAYIRVVRELYAEGVDVGEFVDHDVTVVTATIMGATIWGYRWFNDTGSLSIDQVADEIWGLLANGYVRKD